MARGPRLKEHDLEQLRRERRREEGREGGMEGGREGGREGGGAKFRNGSANKMY